MNFVIISDSHGSLAAWKKVEKYFSQADMVLHAGDLLYHGARNPLPEGYDTRGLVKKINDTDNLLAVKGNVDALVDDWVLPYPLPEYSVVVDNKIKIVLYHGYQHETEEERINFAKRFSADILIYGHTHVPELKQKDGIILINPGSIALPKQNPKIATFVTFLAGEISLIALDSGKKLNSLNL